MPLVAANDVHFHHPARRPLDDVLTAMRHGCTVAEAGELLFPNAERHLKSPDEMRELFRRVAGGDCAHGRNRRSLHVFARRAALRISRRTCAAGQTPLEYLTQLTWEGAARRYPHGIPAKVRDLIEHELELIDELHYEAYFLTVWDLVRFARAQDILCQGRGSAANSAVCYCLGVTSVDPERIDVLFERFVSKERNEAPDIDVDFEHERREEVIAVRLREVRPRAGRHDGRGDHLSAALGGARRRQGAGPVARSRRCAGQARSIITRTSRQLAPAAAAKPASIPTRGWAGSCIALVERDCSAFRGTCRSTSAAW